MEIRKPVVLFVLSQKLGWSTYCKQLEQAAEQQDRFSPIFYRYDPPRWAMAPCRKFYAAGYKRLFQQVDPMLVAQWYIGRWYQRLLCEVKPDAVHTVTQVLARPFLPKSKVIPLSVTIDCTRQLALREIRPGCFSKKDTEREAKVFHCSSKIISITRWAAESVQEDYGADDSRVDVVGPPVCVDVPQAHHDMDGRPVRIGFLGSAFARKGGPELLKWHQTHFRDRAELHIVSRTAPQFRYPNTIIQGHVAYQDVINHFFPSLDLFCLPTKKEMAGFVLAEAAAAGVPCITYDTGGTAEIVRHEVSGLVIRLGDEEGFVAAMRRLIDNHVERRNFGLAARQIAEREFDQKNHFDRVFRLISDPLEAK